MILVDRKAGLRAILPQNPSVLFADHVPGKGEGLAEAVRAAGLSGLIAKRRESAYVAGASSDWVSIIPISRRTRSASSSRSWK